MASALGSQLQALASTHLQIPSDRRPITRPSILFDPREAADIDLQTVFALAQSGLDELTNMDSRFEAYKKTLFGQESYQIDRDLQGKEFNVKLDISICTYLRLLSGFLLLTPAHQTLEYLIRRYKIHMYNVDDVMKNILPYHETSLFVRIVQILQIEKTKWQFLEGVKKSGAALPRMVLIQQCVRDLSVLQAICESAIMLSACTAKSRTMISFSVAVMMEYVGGVQKLDSDIVSRVIPYVLHGFEKEAAEEFCVGCLMIVGTLSSRTLLSQGIVESLLNTMAKFCQTQAQTMEADRLLRMCLMVMVQLAQTQELNHFPHKAFKFLAKVSGFVGVLVELTKTFNTDKFIRLFLKILIEQCMTNFIYEQMLLQLINIHPLKLHVESIISNILDLNMSLSNTPNNQAQDEDAKQLKSREVLNRVLLAIEKRYPVELDEGITKYLEYTDDKERISSTVELLREVLQGTLHAPMVGSNSSVYLSLENSEACVRGEAVRQLSEIACTAIKMKNVEMIPLLQEALLRRLHDDNLRVVRFTLSTECLVKIIDADQLLKALMSVLARCDAALQNGTKLVRGETKSLMRQCFRFLCSNFLEENPGYLSNIGCILLSHLLLCRKTWKGNLAALKLAKEVPWNLFDGLSQLEDDTETTDDTSKAQRNSWHGNQNRKIICCLADNSLKEPARLSTLMHCAVNYIGAKPLVILVLIQYFSSVTKETIGGAVEEVFDFYKQEWLAVESEDEFSSSTLQQVYRVLNGTDMLLYEPHQLLDLERELVYPALLVVAFYRLLKNAPAVDLDDQDQRGAWDGILEDLFVFFCISSSRILFEDHIRLILKCVATYAVTFLSKFFTAEGSSVPVAAQVSSLGFVVSEPGIGLLGSSHAKCIQTAQVQLAMPRLLVALASPIKSVRRSASDCIKKLCDFWRDHASFLAKNGTQSLQVALLPPDTFATLLEALTASLRAFSSDANFLALFLTSLLNPRNLDAKPQVTPYNRARLSNSSRKSIFLFILHHALQLETYAKCVLVIALQGAGHVVEYVFETRVLLNSLLKRRKQFQAQLGSCRNLSCLEIQLLKSLLQTLLEHVNVLTPTTGSMPVRGIIAHTLTEVLNIEGCCVEDAAVVEPCQVALDCLTSEVFSFLDAKSQDEVLWTLLSLSRSESKTVRSSSVSALQRIDMELTGVVKHIDKLMSQEISAKFPFSFSSSMVAASGLLDFLVWKVNMKDRQKLVAPLFRLLRKLFHLGFSNQMPAAAIETVSYVQQLSLTVLGNILSSNMGQGVEYVEHVDFELLVRFIHEALDVSARNQALTLLATLARLFPNQVLNFVMSVVSIVGETTVVLDDSLSHQVTKELISAVVPSWLAKTNEPEKLLQVFVKALPHIPVYRRIPLVKHTLSVMGEGASLHIFLLLAFTAALSEFKVAKSSHKIVRHSNDEVNKELEWDEWVQEFCGQLCDQYTPSVKLSVFVNLLINSRSDLMRENVKTAEGDIKKYEMHWLLQKNVVDFTATQLQRMDRHHELEIDEDGTSHEEGFIALIEQALLHLQMISDRNAYAVNPSLRVKKWLQESLHSLLDSCTNLMSPASFAKGMTLLLTQSESDMKLKVLDLLTSKLRGENEAVKESRGKRQPVKRSNSEEAVSSESLESYSLMVLGITELLGSLEDGSLKLKLAAISALEISALKFAKKLPSPFVSSLTTLIKSLQSNRKLAAASLHCIASIMSYVGTSMLPILPEFMSELLNIAQQYVSWFNEAGENGKLHPKTLDGGSEVLLAILTTLEATVDKLGSFLSPNLQQILNFLILHPAVNANDDENLSKKAVSVRALLPQKIPVRLLLEPLLGTYDMALQAGEVSTAAYFQIVSLLAKTLDRPSVSLYHTKIFDLCLAAFDLRCRPPKSFVSVTNVESSVISVFTGLALKLSESTFKPLFIKILEWSESQNFDEEEVSSRCNVHRSIVFYRVVNELADKLRSVFVPYFHYLLDSCIYHLTKGDAYTKCRKKIKLTDERPERKNKHNMLTCSEWHVRQLVVSAFCKCFLYDTVGFLDATKFQLLLVPIVCQITVEPPIHASNSVFESNDVSRTNEMIPSVDEMDETLVSCLGQMALTAGTDLLWKALNHEVLLCTRNESARARRLGLEVVKFLVDHLKEDYLVLLPETIPFLAELLEDSELTIVAKSQEIIKLLEDLSGESLSQYL